MYLKHFDLSQRPFSITPDPRFVYMSPRHREALAHLLYGLGEGGGFVQLTGEVGTGKTTMCRCLLEKVPDNVDTALVLNPKLTSFELIATICDELGIEYQAENASIKTLTDVLNHHLLAAHARGRRTVLILDEAQNLSTEVLEQIRLLTNLETSTQKLLQIILIGQPELRKLLQREDMRQLAQRVTARYRLEPLTREETEGYIKHRLHVCGTTRPLFSKPAIDLVYRLSGGIPRLVNVLCDRALLGAYTEGKVQIDKRIVRRSAQEVLADELQQSRARPVSAWLGGGLAVLILASLALYLYGPWADPTDAAQHVTAPAAAVVEDAVAETQTALPEDVPVAGNPPETDAAAAMQTRPENLAARLLEAEGSWSLAAWTELFALWSVRLPAAVAPDYCLFAADLGLRCVAERGSWGLLRQYNRPVIMSLLAGDGSSVPALLRYLDDGLAELVLGGSTLRVPVDSVDRHWLGNFTLLVLTPPDGRLLLKAGDRNPDVAWLRQLLETALQTKLPAADPAFFDETLHRQVIAFQRSRGLAPDGVVGRQTLMQLSSYSGRDIPMLSVDPS